MSGSKLPYHTHPGNIVAEFMAGHTRIKICDDFCRETSKDETDGRLTGLAQQILLELEWDEETHVFKTRDVQ